MFAARHGFFKDAEVPFGRLQPYIAVGPGLLFSSLRPKLSVNGYTLVSNGDTFNAPAKGVSPESDYSVNVCLATEAGVRYMALKNVSIDLSFKYRFAQPQYSYDYVDSLGGVGNRLHLNPTYNFFSGQLGVAYHF